MRYGRTVRGSSPREEAIDLERVREMGELIYIKEWISASNLEDLQECEFDKIHKDLLVKELIDNKYVICGDSHQSFNLKCIPLFNDGYLMLSMRRWAEVMHDAYLQIAPEVWPEPYFYSVALCDVEENLPHE